MIGEEVCALLSISLAICASIAICLNYWIGEVKERGELYSLRYTISQLEQVFNDSFYQAGFDCNQLNYDGAQMMIVDLESNNNVTCGEKEGGKVVSLPCLIEGKRPCKVFIRR